jgi:predicted GH43/DUF377 family glycosyl hydrolase
MGLAAGGVGHIGYAESQNAITWTRPYPEPVLSPGNYGEWDATNVTPGAIIKVDGIYKMYYGGWADQEGQWSIGLATSSDGIHWNKYPNNPVLKGTSGWEYQISPSSVIQIEGKYYMYYTARNFPNYSIGLATSSDGINWTRYSGNPILSPTNSWESTGVYNPSIISDNGIFKMVYSNAYPNNALGIATSTNGINWNKSEENPIFDNQKTTDNWGLGAIGYPFLIKINNEYRIYYSGRLPDSDIYRIGYTYRNAN